MFDNESNSSGNDKDGTRARGHVSNDATLSMLEHSDMAVVAGECNALLEPLLSAGRDDVLITSKAVLALKEALTDLLDRYQQMGSPPAGERPGHQGRQLSAA